MGLGCFKSARVKESREVINWAEMVRGANQLADNKYQLPTAKRHTAMFNKKLRYLLSVICYLSLRVSKLSILHYDNLSHIKRIFQS